MKNKIIVTIAMIEGTIKQINAPSDIAPKFTQAVAIIIERSPDAAIVNMENFLVKIEI